MQVHLCGSWSGSKYRGQVEGSALQTTEVALHKLSLVKRARQQAPALVAIAPGRRRENQRRSAACVL